MGMDNVGELPSFYVLILSATAIEIAKKASSYWTPDRNGKS
jgi:hypothetical protein